MCVCLCLELYRICSYKVLHALQVAFDFRSEFTLTGIRLYGW